MPKTINCTKHGQQGFGLVCVHIAMAVDEDRKVGFYYGRDDDMARPDAWCFDCETRLLALKGASSEQWFRDGQYKIFCAKCWDDAKVICGVTRAV